jgi:hypothetical protein
MLHRSPGFPKHKAAGAHFHHQCPFTEFVCRSHTQENRVHGTYVHIDEIKVRILCRDDAPLFVMVVVADAVHHAKRL